MSNETKNKPVETLRDGAIKINIWGNESEHGVRYSTDELSRGYVDQNGTWKNTGSLSNGDILKGARLLQRAYDRITELRSQDKATADDGVQS